MSDVWHLYGYDTCMICLSHLLIWVSDGVDLYGTCMTLAWHLYDIAKRVCARLVWHWSGTCMTHAWYLHSITHSRHVTRVLWWLHTCMLYARYLYPTCMTQLWWHTWSVGSMAWLLYGLTLVCRWYGNCMTHVYDTCVWHLFDNCMTMVCLWSDTFV